ncbi:MAG: exonuclease domain-containing protein [Oscillospiraceae bacterium]
MNYIVMDMEWNQAMSSKSSVFNRLPIHLRGEIIQIGAVKLTEDMTPGEEFQIDVKPVYFRKMHYKVKKLTGIDSQRLSEACGFKEAMKKFRAFCGDGCTFLTWGYDDKGIMEQNIIVHDLDWDWIAGWVNLQLIYNMQTDGDKNQKALSTAMEHFGIEQTRVAHDALGDAYNTALVCSHLNMAEGLAKYDDTVRQLSMRPKKPAMEEGEEGPEPVEHLSFTGYATRSEAFGDENLSAVKCPECGGSMETQRWVNQGDRRYMSLAACPEHGRYLVRVKFRKAADETWTANRILYKADEEMETFYKAKASQNRKRARRRKKAAASEK